MVNSRPCETARPSFKILETKSRIRDSKSPETKLRDPSETGIRGYEIGLSETHTFGGAILYP